MAVLSRVADSNTLMSSRWDPIVLDPIYDTPFIEGLKAAADKTDESDILLHVP